LKVKNLQCGANQSSARQRGEITGPKYRCARFLHWSSG